MPIYTHPTPTPIDVAINLPVGRIDVIATDRTDAIVTVEPTSPSKPLDVRGADKTVVTFDGGRLTVTAPKPRFTVVGPNESMDITVEIPSGSRLTAELSVGNVRTSGRLGATRIKAMTGSVDVDGTGDLWLRAGHGGTTVGTADGSIELTADHGQIRIGTVTGDAILKSSYGNIQIGETGGDLEAKLSYGDLEIANAKASVAAKTAYGSITLGEVSSGSVQLESGYGQIEVGVRAGVPAWLDLAAKSGHVRNGLDGDRAPAGDEQTVSVRARTSTGDINIHRSVQQKGK